jgi:hypothetical protein
MVATQTAAIGTERQLREQLEELSRRIRNLEQGDAIIQYPRRLFFQSSGGKSFRMDVNDAGSVTITDQDQVVSTIGPADVAAAAWGGIGGSLASQTDLAAALAAKLDDVQASAFGLTLLAAAGAGAAKTLLTLAKADVGLGNADNTRDVDKGVSGPQATALAGKQDLSEILTALSGLDGEAGLVEHDGGIAFVKRRIGGINASDILDRASADMRYALISSAAGAGAAIQASEALTAGALCNVFTSAGAVRVQKANATDATKPANAYAKAAVLAGSVASIGFVGQVITGLAGLTPGTTYWLDTIGGALALVPPSGGGNGVQEVGVALSATTLLFHPKPMIGL